MLAIRRSRRALRNHSSEAVPRGFVRPRLIDMECYTLWIRKDEEIACSWTHEVERAVNAEASVAEILGKCRGQKPSCSRVFSGKPLMRPENSGVEIVPSRRKLIRFGVHAGERPPS